LIRTRISIIAKNPHKKIFQKIWTARVILE
jgi:hypothetical protein